MLKKFPSDKINGTKNAPFFLSQTFTFKLRFLYEMKHNIRLSKTFRFRFVFIKVYIFVQKNTWTL